MTYKTPEARVRSEEHVSRLTAALVHEEVEFTVRPEPDGWWLIRAKIAEPTLHGLTASTLHAPIVEPAWGRRVDD